MRCIKCRQVNINSANYCKNCGYHFSDRERKAAKKGTLVWFLEGFDKIKNLWKFQFITDHILFKVASIIIVLAIGIYSWFMNGNDLKILNSSQYQIQYNTKLSEYYLLVSEEQTELNLYIPNQIDKISIQHLDKDDKVIEEFDYSKTDNIILENNSEEDHYMIEGVYKNSLSDKIKIYIYKIGKESE